MTGSYLSDTAPAATTNERQEGGFANIAPNPVHLPASPHLPIPTQSQFRLRLVFLSPFNPRNHLVTE